MEYPIRPAEPRDSPHIMAMIQELAKYEKITHFITLTGEVLHRDGFGDNPWFRCLVAELPENETRETGVPFAGYALFANSYSSWTGRTLHLEDLYVSPHLRGKGIGKKLMKKVAEMVPVMVEQPMAVAQTVSVAKENAWATGVCDCCDDCSVCCFAFCCLPCFQCSTASDFGECLCLPLLEPGFLGMFGLGGCSAPISVAMRAAVRERYRIPGSICNDCCLVCWCYSCVWCQLSREIKKRKQTITMVTAQTTEMSIRHPQFIQYSTLPATEPKSTR
ncbi:uncharacterized protein LOC128491018 isoform X1 [Spea bombifrons]|uniref:uncharacterized protein LOC128491018 isoform X1 n=1 Tax=Spea bombifrons TaxID=233779 RepID=UPI0023494F30|nr:uncharacterized protein LOC128491018 isoform X1 [Spea bombifrons]